MSSSGRFQVSPKAIFAAPCQVELAIACQQDHLDSRLNNVDDLATDPASAYFLLLPVPTFAQVTRPSSRGSQSPSKMSRLIRLTSTYKKRGAQTAVLLALSLASDFGRLESGNSSNSHRPHCARTPASPTLGSRYRPFDFHVTASLLGKIATAFCRDGQPERPGDLIC